MPLRLVVLGRNMRILVLLASVNLYSTVLLQDVEVVHRTTQFQLGPYYFITTLAGHEVGNWSCYRVSHEFCCHKWWTNAGCLLHRMARHC